MKNGNCLASSCGTEEHVYVYGRISMSDKNEMELIEKDGVALEGRSYDH